ncbi:Crp/Fnr family transcriptional regulator [Streptomyces inusitatus]|uniref:Crp/Fnr family transcriptional regulator n=2 Tax=Streptomyces inusitatus TaxID=68221 RepID=A0A918Q7W3_9ACTN|nr:Crp/Fnr family transcriptional regulator [Streptomyces inusitatus]
MTRRPLGFRPPGVTLLEQGTPGTGAFALISGMVKVIRRDRGDRQRLLAFRGPGEVLGEMALQYGGERLADVRTMSRCRVVWISAGDFHHLVKQHDLAYSLAVVASSRLREQTEMYDGAIHQRLAMALLRLVDISEGVCSFSLTREELAQHIGAGRNSVTKGLRALGPDKVRVEKGRIIVSSVEGLKRALADAGP